MKASDQCEAYNCHLTSIDDGNYLGVLDAGSSFSLREACNKIIHAHDVRPVFERVDRQVNDNGLEQDLWYLTGEIELQGTRGKAAWTATIYGSFSLHVGSPVLL